MTSTSSYSRKAVWFFAVCASVTHTYAADDAHRALQDFREAPLKYKEELTEKNLTPSVDEKYIRDRLARIVRTVDTDTKWVTPTVWSLRPHKSLSYHLSVRIDDPRTGVRDFDLPQLTKNADSPVASSTLSPEFGKFLTFIDESASEIAQLTGMLREPDPSRADLLIRINLADRQQASEGFALESMSTLAQRTGSHRSTEHAEPLVYALPWSIVRVYHRTVGTSKGIERIVDGGEIWIQYPIRTYWQETIARHALSDPNLALQLGLGTSRRDVVAHFRTPHKTDLPPLTDTLRSQRLLWDYPRPNENLLSIASGTLQELEKGGTPAAPVDPVYRSYCAAESHASVLSRRLARAMTVVAGGLRSNALLVSPAGDYTAEFGENSDGLLANLSLQDYRSSFDIRLDDQLAPIALKVAHEAHRGRGLYELPTVPWTHKHPTIEAIIDGIMKTQRPAIENALNRVAESFTDDCNMQPAALRSGWQSLQ